MIKLNSIIQAFLTSCGFFLLFTCKDNDPIPYKSDYIKFEINSTERIYEYKDSVIQNCVFDATNHNVFYIEKVYDSHDGEFTSFSIRFVGTTSVCPPIKLNSINSDFDPDFTFTLTKESSSDKFIDFTNFGKLESLQWTQKLQEGEIIVTGNFSGWLYQYFITRPKGVIEPEKRDSLYIKNGEFQLTTK